MWAWFCFALALVIASVVYLIRVRSPRFERTRGRQAGNLSGAATPPPQRLSASTVTLATKVVVCLGWGVSLFVLALVPLDVVVVRPPTQHACALSQRLAAHGPHRR